MNKGTIKGIKKFLKEYVGEITDKVNIDIIQMDLPGLLGLPSLSNPTPDIDIRNTSYYEYTYVHPPVKLSISEIPIGMSIYEYVYGK